MTNTTTDATINIITNAMINTTTSATINTTNTINTINTSNTTINEMYIPKDEFDWDYYLNHNPDVRKAGITGIEGCYRHWIMYGCYENRLVKSSKTGKEVRVKLKSQEKFLPKPPPPLTPVTPSISPIDLGFKIAVLIHIFDINLFPFFISYLNHLSNLYLNDNFDIYINIVEENSPYKGDLKLAIKAHIKNLINPNFSYFLSENRGGDIGGFLLLSKYIIESGIDYKYAIFVHSKTRAQWRKDLCQTIFNIPFEQLSKTPDMGLISSKKWLMTFDPIKQKEEYQRFRYHLVDLCEIYDVECRQAWQFIAGTMFLANIELIKYIAKTRIDEVYEKLNKLDSIDINWLTLVTDELRKDPRGTGNDLQYRLKYGRSLHPDYMIEHTFERIIGLICNKLGLKVIGQ
jgi:hypothetical protein